jgi:hypothetical protein
MSGKSRQHAACHSLKAACCGPGRSILAHLLSVHCRHAKTSVILACWWPRWHPRGGWGSNVQLRHLSQWTAPGAQHAPVKWPPFTFGRPLPARCWASTYVLLFPTTWAPSNRTSQRAVKGAAIPVDCHGAQHVPVVRPPSTYSRILRPGFEFSPRACAGPEAAVVDDEGLRGRSLWRTIQAITLPSSSQILTTRPVVAISLPTSRFNVPGPPHVVLLRTQAVRMKSLQAAELPADLAPICFNCWQSTVLLYTYLHIFTALKHNLKV